MAGAPIPPLAGTPRKEGFSVIEGCSAMLAQKLLWHWLSVGGGCGK